MPSTIGLRPTGDSQRIAIPFTTSSNHLVVNSQNDNNNGSQQKATHRARAWNLPRSSGAAEWRLSDTPPKPSKKGSIRQANRQSANTNSSTSATIEHVTSLINRHANRQRGQLPPQLQNRDGGREDCGHGTDARSHGQAVTQGKTRRLVQDGR